MGFRRNWFIYLSLFLYLAASIMILNLGITGLADQRENSYLINALLYLGFFGGYVLINILFFLITRPWLVKLVTPLKKVSPWLEALLVIFILAAGIALRFYYIYHYPVAMESDYKLYYDVATLIKEGTLLTESNNEFVALFPHTFGCAFVLSKVMSVFGTSPEVCLYFSAVLSVLTGLLCYGIGKIAAGSIAGITALLFSCFWPSQIMYSNFNGSEAIFTFLLYSAALLLMYVMKKYNGTNSNAILPMVLHFTIGILLGLASSVRPMSLIFLIAVVLCLLLLNYKLQYKKSIMEVSFQTIFLSKGWMRAVLVLLGYFICSQLVTASISQAIQKNIAGSGSLGYSLMVGVDIENDAGYSQKSTDILYQAYEESESADMAHQVCMDYAMEEIKANPIGTLELFAKKISILWADDNYARTININTMKNQGLLTSDREVFLKKLADINNVYYLFIIFLATIGVCFLFVRDNNTQVFVVFFVGTIVLHLLVEAQNRYHYYLLQNFSILAAVGVGLLFRTYMEKTQSRLLLKKMKMQVAETALEAAVTMEDPEETGLPEQCGSKELKHQEESKLNTIDVIKAIENGHIIITATETYGDKITATEELVTEAMDDSVQLNQDEILGQHQDIEEIIQEETIPDEIVTIQMDGTVETENMIDASEAPSQNGETEEHTAPSIEIQEANDNLTQIEETTDTKTEKLPEKVKVPMGNRKKVSARKEAPKKSLKIFENKNYEITISFSRSNTEQPRKAKKRKYISTK